ncbi:oxidoreductase [Paraflavisolibacter sp. H34]|uniref:oxidoreductase n=1 Tax=Huijunlia imazamoxiresistens TaxID=3127457 RepID=UPI003015DBC3
MEQATPSTNTDSKVWFITGCSTGFGRELAKLLLTKGYKVVVTARKVEQVNDLAEGYGQTALALPLDVTDKAQIAAAVAQAEATFGRIDVLVNNAGYGYFSSIEEGEDEKIRAQFETNVFGLVQMTQAVLPGMRQRRSGHIVNFSSISGLVGLAATGYYHATKFAVEGLSEALAKEVAPLGINVLLVEPGPFRTDWAGRSLSRTPVQIEDYRPTVGARMAGLEQISGNQPGDPVRGCAAIITAVEANEPLPRLLLGKVAYTLALQKVEELKANFTAWKDLTLGADFPEGQ